MTTAILERWFPAFAFVLLAATSSVPVLAQPTDAEIVSMITRQLIDRPGTAGLRAEVSAENGIVTLTGEADNILAKDRAVRLSESVRGVRAVINRIQVVASERSDAEVRAAVKDALLHDPVTEPWDIDVRVDEGRVTLGGTVQSWQERTFAERVVKGVTGVREVDNDLLVEFRQVRTDGEIVEEVQRRLEWDARVDSSLITVTAEDGTVVLAGTVGSAAEKRRAIFDARVAGVKDVRAENLAVTFWDDENEARRNTVAKRSDDQIANAIRDAMLYDPRVVALDIGVRVDDGVVTLTGEVADPEAKRAAERNAGNTVGVRHVINRIEVRPSPPQREQS